MTVCFDRALFLFGITFSILFGVIGWTRDNGVGRHIDIYTKYDTQPHDCTHEYTHTYSHTHTHTHTHILTHTHTYSHTHTHTHTLTHSIDG